MLVDDPSGSSPLFHPWYWVAAFRAVPLLTFALCWSLWSCLLFLLLIELSYHKMSSSYTPGTKDFERALSR